MQQLDEIKRLILAGAIEEAMSLALSAGLSQIYDGSAMAELHNRSRGALAGHDCPACNNKGYTVSFTDGQEYIKPCACLKAREATKNIDRSGLASVLKAWTFDAFEAEHPWQKTMKDIAQQYVEAVKGGSDEWLCIMGQPGCGKTHLCTAVCGELLNAGIPVRYMIWRDEAERIKADRLDADAMAELLEPLKQVDVLYIDDLHKGVRTDLRGHPLPTDAENRLCFEILNARYVRKKPTILTSEWSLTEDLVDVDEASFSRAYQKSKRFICQVGRDRSRNYRLVAGGCV